jgi:RNA polymerase sigma factor (sigma-70 family)
VELNLRARVRAGDPAAFRELFDDHARSVYNHGYRLTGDWSAAEDVVSLTFLEAWRLRDRVDAGAEAGSLRSWLFGIATNVARNLRRTARRHAAALARLSPAEAVPDFAEEVAGRIRDRERLTLVRTALAALRQPEREVLALCVWSGLDYAEAAAALGVPVGTVRSRLSRARTRLQKLVTAGKLTPAREIPEPVGGRGQIPVDRTIAVRFAQEKTR